MEVAPSSIGQGHMPMRVAHRPAPASVGPLPDTGRRAEPTAWLASHRQVEDQEVSPVSQELGAGAQHDTARLSEALAAWPQQPLTQLPSPGYNAIGAWPERAPAPQQLMPPLEERRPLSAQPQCMLTPRHAAVSGTAWRSTPAAVRTFPAGGHSAEMLSEQRQWPQEAAASRQGTAHGHLGRDGPPAFPAAQEWGHRECDAAHVRAGAAVLHTGQSLGSAMPAAPHVQAHNPMQQQQDFSFQRPQVQQRGYAPQQSDLAPTTDFTGASSRARSPWDLAQPVAASGRAQQQPFSAQPFPAQVQDCQQEMSPLLQAPHTRARQQPTYAMGTGHTSLPAGGQPGMAVYGNSPQEHQATMTGAGYSILRPAGGPTIAVHGSSLPAQQQRMWQNALPMQEGQVQASTAWGPTPIGTHMAYSSPAAYSAPPPQQQPWHHQQMS